MGVGEEIIHSPNDLTPPLAVGVSHMINIDHVIVIRLGSAAG